MSTLSMQQQTLQILEQLPPAGLTELAQYMEFLRFKYRPKVVARATPKMKGQLEIPPDSLTARFRGFVSSPLSVNALATAYEFYVMGDLE